MDNVSAQARSRIMSAIQSKHTKPEVTIRKTLRENKIKYRLHYGKEKIDIAIPEKRIAIFIDGCFWHQCPQHSHTPKTNKRYWLPKLKSNITRAKEKDKRLRNSNWKVIHIWEHDINQTPEKCTDRIKKAI